MYGLYLHIPFCVRKCLYCDFYSLPSVQGPIPRRLATYHLADQSSFLSALDIELSLLPPGFRPATLFLGGGTPTELSDRDFARLFEILHHRVDLSALIEATCESNPGTLTPEKANILKQAGITRVSLGIQSFQPSALEFLGRIHTRDEAIAGYHLLRRTGFDNINLDLIYGIPAMTLDHLRADLQTLIELAPDHAACYCLIFEDGTPLAELRRKGYVKEVDDDTELEQYNLIRERLAHAGYQHYELSNFSRPGRQCQHNLLYWGDGEYIGCGPSAHSHWNGKRWGNLRSLDRYIDHLHTGTSIREQEEALDPAAKARETLVFALRRIEGIDPHGFHHQTGFALHDLCGPTLEWMQQEGLVDYQPHRLRLTERGLFLSDGIFAELV
ncbi:MAG TPA: radical SAM family heme chaperone HemW [Kiritimatiellia bacterium]|nr:radical SAM family heme chaperone HemW [Kiritimatiellia bacterium]